MAKRKFEVDMSLSTGPVGFEPGSCPYCGSYKIDYQAVEFSDLDAIYYPADCLECGNSFDEYYTLEFDAQYGYPLKSKKKNKGIPKEKKGKK